MPLGDDGGWIAIDSLHKLHPHMVSGKLTGMIVAAIDSVDSQSHCTRSTMCGVCRGSVHVREMFFTSFPSHSSPLLTLAVGVCDNRSHLARLLCSSIFGNVP